ncbi:hypothetical protein BDQ17DRAFT_1433529 [Cyathus striatus]|nr:hypothetical protein BDQ17DRAFT_1433529 [Cyathus striatus]
MSQYNIVVSSLEEQTAKQQHLEMAATNMAPMVLLGDVGHHLEGTGELPNLFLIIAMSMAELNDLPIPPVSSMKNLDLAVKWGLLDKHGLNSSLGTCITRSSHSKSTGVIINKIMNKNKPVDHIIKMYLEVAQLDTSNNTDTIPISEPPERMSSLVDKDGMVKIEVIGKYKMPDSFIKPEKTVKTLKVTHKALESLPHYFPQEFANTDNEKRLRELNVIKKSADQIKRFFGCSPDLPLNNIFRDIMGDGELYLDEYIIPLPQFPEPPVHSPLSFYRSSISSFTSTESQLEELSEISEIESEHEVEQLQCAISNSLVTF